MENLPSNRSHQLLTWKEMDNPEALCSPPPLLLSGTLCFGLGGLRGRSHLLLLPGLDLVPLSPCEVGAPCWRDGMGIAALPRTQLPVTKTDNVLSNAPYLCHQTGLVGRADLSRAALSGMRLRQQCCELINGSSGTPPLCKGHGHRVLWVNSPDVSLRPANTPSKLPTSGKS